MFCDKCYVCIDKCVFIVVKIKCVNTDRISVICDKVNFTTNYTHFTTSDISFIKTHTNSTMFNTFGETILQQNLRICPRSPLKKINKKVPCSILKSQIIVDQQKRKSPSSFNKH
jgi:hypothetical protein